MREQLKNNPVTELNEALDGSETAIDVLDGSVFPSVGTFRVLVDDEIMLCTARSTNTLTVVRGYEGTSATTHDSGAAILSNVTAGGLDRWGKDNVPHWGNSSRPPLNSLTDSSGAVIDASDFTATNVTNGDIADDNGSIWFAHDAAGAGEDCAVWSIAAPGTPYSAVMAFQCFMIGTAGGEGSNFGGLFRKASDGKLHTLSIGLKSGDSLDLEFGMQWASYKFDNATTFSSTAQTRQPMAVMTDLLWMKLEDDGTDLKFYLGMDGVHWILVYDEPRTTFMSGGPDQVGFYINNPNNTLQAQAKLVHFSIG